MKKMLKNLAFLLSAFLLLFFLGSCSKPKLENPFDPESSFNTSPMQGDLILTQLTDSEVKLQWQLNSTIVGNYIIKRQVNSGGFEVLTSVDKNTDNYTDTGLLTTNTYNYQVIGANGDVQTEPITNSISTSFAEITNFNIQQENLYTAKLTWQHNCSYEEGYLIERMEIQGKEGILCDKNFNEDNFFDKDPQKTTRFNDYKFSEPVLIDNEKNKFVKIADLEYNSVEFIDDEIKPNKLYHYRIYAYTVLNNSAILDSVFYNAVPQPKNVCYQKLSISSIEICWEGYNNVDVYYQIDKKISNDKWLIEYATLENNSEEWIDENAELNENLRYRVCTVIGEYCSDYSYTDIIDNTIPSPSDLTIKQENVHTFNLNWSDNSNGEDGFIIERKLDDGDYEKVTKTKENQTSYTDNISSKVDSGTLGYRISAFHGSFLSYGTEVIYDITFLPPTNFTATILDIHTIQLDWEDNSNGEEGFIIDRKVYANEWENGYMIVPNNETNCIDINAAIDSLITYRIKAYSGFIFSDSTYTIIDNPFNSPSDVGYSIISENSVELFWQDSSVGEQGFKIDRKVGQNEWEYEYGIVDSNCNIWQDESVDVWTQIMYNVYAFYDKKISKKELTRPCVTFKRYQNTVFGSSSNSVIQTQDGGFLLAGQRNDYSSLPEGQLIKYDVLGNVEWQCTYDGDRSKIACVKETGNDGYLCFGSCTPTGCYKYWLLKTDMSGNILWEQTYNDVYGFNNHATSITVDEDGSYVMAGYSFSTSPEGGFVIKADVNGNVVWSNLYDEIDVIRSIKSTSDGGYVMTGYTSSYGNGSKDFCLLKIDEGGDILWNHAYGGADVDQAYSVLETPDDGFIMVGCTESLGLGPKAGWVLKTDYLGNEDWNYTYGGELHDAFLAAENDVNGGFILTGYTNFTGNIDDEMWLVKLTQNGNLMWEKNYHLNDHTRGFSVCQTMDMGYVVTGFTSSAGCNDSMICKTDNSGNIQENVLIIKQPVCKKELKILSY